MPRMPNVTLFLGAGFSRAFSHGMSDQIPVVTDLFPRILDTLDSFPSGFSDQVLDAAKRIFPHKTPREIDFESFLSAIDDLRRNQNRFRSRRMGNIDADNIWYLIGSALGSSITFKSELNKYSRYKLHPRMNILIEVLEEIRKRCNSVSIITTNYDLVAEKATGGINVRLLGHKNLDTPAPDLRRYTYGEYVRGIWQAKYERSEFLEDVEPWSEFREGIQIYKIHGSINWSYCGTCKALDLSRTRYELSSVYNWKQPPCAQCGAPYNWLIVPPVSEKMYDNEIIKRTWRSAEIALAKSDRLVFIGYKLSPIDSAVERLIVLSKAMAGHAWETWVFNDQKEVHDRFEKVIGQTKTQGLPMLFEFETFKEKFMKQILRPV